MRPLALPDEAPGLSDRQLTAQAEFVLWWDTEAQRREAGKYSKKGTVKDALLLPEDFGLTVKLISKWRTHLNDPDTYETTRDKLYEVARRRIEFDTTAHVGHDLGLVGLFPRRHRRPPVPTVFPRTTQRSV